MKCNVDPLLLYKGYRYLGTLEAAGKTFNIRPATISKILKNNGFVVKRSRKYNCDDGFFSNDTPESFYWAGFIAADGFIKDGNTKQVIIGLSRDDKSHLAKFVQSAKFDGPIRDVTWKERLGVRIDITSAQMVKDLKRFNIVTCKTFCYSFPKWVKSHKYVNHFMRGYFDGDGTYCFQKKSNKTPQLRFSILGTKDFVNEYMNIIRPICKTKTRVYKNESMWTFWIGGNKMNKKIRNFLYANSRQHICLERKRDMAFSPILDQNIRKRKITGISVKNGSTLHFDSMADAERFGFKNKQIWKCCNNKMKQHQGYTWKYL